MSGPGRRSSRIRDLDNTNWGDVELYVGGCQGPLAGGDVPSSQLANFSMPGPSIILN